MRRGAGLAAFERHKTDIQSYATLSENLSRQSLDALQSQLAQFRAALQRFAASHREDIKKDPAFRALFQQMCSNIGVDPLAGPHKGGLWAELLGMGDWQYELGVQIVDICVGTRDQNGGMIYMDDLVRLLNKLRNIPTVDLSKGAGTSKELQDVGAVTEEDVLRSIKTLRPLGAGYEVINIGSRKMVRSVVKELDLDQATILEIAASVGGKVWVDLVAGAASWSVERAAAALENMLLRDGLCWMDDQDEDAPVVYWVMSVLQFD
jgi:ESCRT-II complex subunit VPS22